jgi:hypothetical protein
MKSYKSPNQYGLQLIFFKTFWDIDGDTINIMVQNAFSIRTFPLELA